MASVLDSEAIDVDVVLLHSLSQDLKKVKKVVATMTREQARYLVDTYYQMQNNRIRFNNQIRTQKEEPHEVLSFFSTQTGNLETAIKNALHAYAKSRPTGRWLLSLTGIGPVLAAGLLAHIDIKRSTTAGQLQRFAGLDPTIKWEKGKKRPFNASLKKLCWLIGESFNKVQNNDKDLYGHLSVQRKKYEQQKNEAGAYAQQAAIGAKRVDKKTESYKSYIVGKLPDGHIHQRSKRWAVKLFLSHLHEVMTLLETGEAPAKPYAISILNHSDYIAPPNMAVVELEYLKVWGRPLAAKWHN